MDATTLDLGIVNGGGAYSGFNTMSPLYPQQSALYSHLLRAQGDDAGADQQMQAAVANYFASPYSGLVYAGYSTKALWSRLLCMDWVDFGGQYEAAFELMKTELEAELAGPGADRDWRVDGYWNATHARYSGWVLRTMLALAAYDVNPSGASHAWAESWIDKIGAPVSPSADEAAWSPWAAANVEQLLSRRGGGTEYGHGSTNDAGFGSYEEEFALGVLAVMWAVDTLTDSALMDVRSNLYLTTRHLGLVAERDGDTGYSYAGKACIMAFGKLLRDTDQAAAGAYRWLASGFGNATSGWRELLACAGPDPAEQSPAGVISDRLGSAWHYRADAGDIASLRARHTCHDLEHFRFSPEVGAFDFRFGGVGLTDARVNRGGINGCQSNGFWFGNHCPDGVNPRHISDSQGWGQECTIRKHLLNHAFGPDAVLNDPFYIMGDASGPELQPDGTWQWSVDISTLVGGRPQELVEAGYEVTGPCSIALLFDPGHQRLELTHVLSVSSPYLGWHFAPTHAPVFETGLPAGQDRFTVSDGTDTVRVAIESLDGIGWDRVEKTEHISPTGGAFRLDYHQRATPVVSVAYTPQQRQATHTVKLTMEVV